MGNFGNEPSARFEQLFPVLKYDQNLVQPKPKYLL